MGRPRKDAAVEAAPQEEPVEAMPSLVEAEAELKRAMNAYRAFEGAHKALSVLSNLETVANERKAAADREQLRYVEALDKTEKAEAELEAITAKSNEARATAEKNVTAMYEVARAETDAIKAEAEKRAAELDARADSLTADLLQAQSDLDDLNKQAEKARALIARAEAIQAAMQS